MQRLFKLLAAATLALATFAIAQITTAADRYVATNGTGNGLSGWANATNNLQGAIDAIDSGTVWVSNGVYQTGGVTNYPTGANCFLTNRIAIWKAITVRSANNDPINTVIKGEWNPVTTNGPAAVRCVYMTNGSSLIGFTLTNGAGLTTNEVPVGIQRWDLSGGGVFSQSYLTTISNCIITGNSSAGDGGGAYNGRFFNCAVIGNRAYGGAGFVQGDADCVLSNCVVVGNWAKKYAGGARIATLYNCSLISNSSDGAGGAVEACNLYNCVLFGNRSAARGGAVNAYYGGIYKNCTIVSNYSATGGGGVDNNSGVQGIAKYVNCIIYFNTSGATYSNWYSIGQVDNFTNSCIAPATTNVGSVGNITADPMFIDKDTGNYRLSSSSPCINAGYYESWMATGLDLDNRIRLRYG
ncbi:MAG: hypothetical protein ABIH24_01075, partial [Verrucomicrobiota bacterium]